VAATGAGVVFLAASLLLVPGGGVRARLVAAAGVMHRPVPRSGTARRFLDALGNRARSPSSGRLRSRLAYAGLYARHAAGLYLAVKLLLPAAAAGGAVVFARTSGVPGRSLWLLVCAAAALGVVAPEFWLSKRIAKRQREITHGLSDALDLLVVCVEAGLGLEAALLRVGEEIGDGYPALAEEFRLANLEVRTGGHRGDALRHMAERTGVGDVRALAARIVQTEKFGTSIAKSLRVHSDMLRTRRRQQAEEAAAKTSIRLLFPLVFFVFPALFVVILGPAALMMADALLDLG
jgi:tight adherence protein C